MLNKLFGYQPMTRGAPSTWGFLVWGSRGLNPALGRSPLKVMGKKGWRRAELYILSSRVPPVHSCATVYKEKGLRAGSEEKRRK